MKYIIEIYDGNNEMIYYDHWEADSIHEIETQAEIVGKEMIQYLGKETASYRIRQEQ